MLMIQLYVAIILKFKQYKPIGLLTISVKV